jgi:hypothetical protein
MLWILLFLQQTALGQQFGSGGATVVYIPLDERFTTRQLFLNLAHLTDFDVQTPPLHCICRKKAPANLTALDQWLEDTIFPKGNSRAPVAAVISAELYLYGGLIQSRISNTSQAEVAKRLDKLVSIKRRAPSMKVYLSSVVMRIPAYSGGTEEPW